MGRNSSAAAPGFFGRRPCQFRAARFSAQVHPAPHRPPAPALRTKLLRRQPLRGLRGSVLRPGARSVPAGRATPLARMRFLLLARGACPSLAQAREFPLRLLAKQWGSARLARMRRRESPPRFQLPRKSAMPEVCARLHPLLAQQHSELRTERPPSGSQSLGYETVGSREYGSSGFFSARLPVVGRARGSLISACASSRLRFGF